MATGFVLPLPAGVPEPTLSKCHKQFSSPRRFSRIACVSRFLRISASADSSSHNRQHISLPGRGIGLELVSASDSTPVSTHSNNPIVFIHGSLHGAWCWERFLTHCRREKPEQPAVAVSLRGYTSEPPVPPGTTIKVEDHVADLAAFLEALEGPPPIIVAHSIGGYYAQRLIQELHESGKNVQSIICGLVLLSATPPSGNSSIVFRTVRRFGLRMSWRITMGFVRNTVSQDPSVCRDLFFSRNVEAADPELESDEMLQKYMKEFAKAGQSRVDTRGITAIANPSIADSMDGRVSVIGGSEDIIVDSQALDETALFWTSKDPVTLLPDVPHDMMLATGWEKCADVVLDAVESLTPAETPKPNSTSKR